MYSDLIKNFEFLSGLYRDGKLNSIIPLMPLLQLEGEPYGLIDHFQFEPLFSLTRPKRSVLKCARQVGKSQNVCGRNLILSWLIPYFRSLFVLPRFEQTKRLSTGIVKQFIDESPFKQLFVDKTCEQSILEKSYLRTMARQYFSFAFLDPDRVRSISNISDLYFDEVQDLNWDFIPVIGEVTSAAKQFGFLNFSGTPKTLDNTLTALWQDSSQGEWITKCGGCNKYNIPDLEHDVMEMIGGKTCVCAKCKKELDCSTGTFVHKFPERRASFAGWHVPQIVHPLHYNYSKYPGKWDEILYKQRTYPKARFLNEVLGIEYDSLDKLMTQSQLASACDDRLRNEYRDALKNRKGCPIVAMGVDWGGGGQESMSFTTIAVGGVPAGQDSIQTFYMEKLDRNMEPQDEVTRILQIFRDFRPDFIAHDYGGAGALRETMLLQAGVPLERVIPYTYVFSPGKAIISYNQATAGYRSSYSLDNTRSILVLCAMIRAGKVRFPSWKTSAEMQINGVDISLAMDFTHIQEERSQTPRGSDIVLIKTTPKKSDDVVSAVNYMASTLWYTQQRYPNLAQAVNISLSPQDLADLNG